MRIKYFVTEIEQDFPGAEFFNEARYCNDLDAVLAFVSEFATEHGYNAGKGGHHVWMSDYNNNRLMIIKEQEV